jgi:exodeoxyribonuclease V gamma subunit
MAARQRLHFTFVGRSAKDNSECSPSIVLTELLDHLDRTCRPPPGFRHPSAFVHVRHPLQPWSRRYLDGADARLFTYARHGTPGPVRTAERPWFGAGAALPVPAPAAEIALDDLLEFWWHPCRHFLQHTLRVRVRRDDDREHETEPFSLHNLDKYHLQDEAVRQALRGEGPPRDPEALARATGRLPVGAHGTAAFAQLDAETRQFLHVVRNHAAQQRRRLCASGEGFTIAGDVDGLGAELVRIRFTRLKPKDRLRAWLLHLVVATARAQGEADLPVRTRLLCKDKTCRIDELPHELVAAQLAWLVAHYRLGQAAPLPFFERSSYCYGKLIASGRDAGDALRAARREWEGEAGPEFALADGEEANVELCMRGRDPLAEPEFARLAAQLWGTACRFLQEDDA